MLDEVEAAIDAPRGTATRLLDAETKIGRYVLGEGIAVAETAESLRRVGAQRAILVSEPGAWAAAGAAIADGLAADGWPVEHVLLPQGEDAKRLYRHRGGGPRAGAPARRAFGADRGDRRRGAGRRRGLPRGDVPAWDPSICMCRRRSSPRSTRRSAARPGSTCPRARTWSARSISRRPSSSTSRCSRRSPSARRAALGEAVKMAARPRRRAAVRAARGRWRGDRPW